MTLVDLFELQTRVRKLPWNEQVFVEVRFPSSAKCDAVILDVRGATGWKIEHRFVVAPA